MSSLRHHLFWWELVCIFLTVRDLQQNTLCHYKHEVMRRKTWFVLYLMPTQLTDCWVLFQLYPSSLEQLHSTFQGLQTSCLQKMNNFYLDFFPLYLRDNHAFFTCPAITTLHVDPSSSKTSAESHPHFNSNKSSRSPAMRKDGPSLQKRILPNNILNIFTFQKAQVQIIFQKVENHHSF